MTFSQKQYNPDGDGPLEKYLAANDNVPLDESGASAGFGVGGERGMYIGLRRGTEDKRDWNENLPRTGQFMQTYTARKYWPCDPRADEVFIEDIAHSLSLQCRYAGHCLNFYSVAEHSVHIARWLLREYGPLTALYGLLHDATEAFCVDVPRPLKPSLTNYKAIEQRNWLVIAERFGLPSAMPDAVHEADTRVIGDELVNMQPMDWHARHDKPLGVKIGCWSPAIAEREFLWTFEALSRDTYSVRMAA
jgi:hypothetical protein